MSGDGGPIGEATNRRLLVGLVVAWFAALALLLAGACVEVTLIGPPILVVAIQIGWLMVVLTFLEWAAYRNAHRLRR